jgi:hypothetical protein
MAETGQGMSIGQVSVRTGLSVHTLRFYERDGLFASLPQRGPDGRRVYSEDDLGWLAMCTNFRAPACRYRRYVVTRAWSGKDPETRSTGSPCCASIKST